MQDNSDRSVDDDATDESDEDATDESDEDATDENDEDATDETERRSISETQLPIDGTALVKTGAIASVPLSRLPELLYRVQRHLRDRVDDYRQTYERIHTSAERETFLVEEGHWDDVGEELGLADREADAVRRAHEAQLERLGSNMDRREEIETALEIRTAVVIGVGEE